jgi:predicted oxidoreductase
MLTKGGPLMSVDAEVLNADSQPIPGLYQCGELVGGGNIGGSANIGGLANTICMVWGKIAGENAAAFAQANK